jgi:spore maturation protein CgeB
MTHGLRRLPRILLLSARQHLMAELAAGCRAIGIEHASLYLGDVASAAELETRLLTAMNAHQPDFLLTINHSGLDREGLVSGLCRHIRMPLLSWFVDRPELFLPAYANLENPYLAYAVWDADAVSGLEAMAGGRVFHLPLGADLSRIEFLPQARHDRDVAFVGNSMQAAAERSWDASGRPENERVFWDSLAVAFAVSERRDVGEYLRQEWPEAWKRKLALDGEEATALDAFLYWRSTQHYRTRCVRELLPFAPVVGGTPGGRNCSDPVVDAWRAAEHYADLPVFYRQTAINFNTTSMQMKGALNQRVFDVPASGGFLLTDRRDQLAAVFEDGEEAVCYDSPEEIGSLVRHWLGNPAARLRIAARARKRIEGEHTYGHRVAYICRHMRVMFGTPA